MTEREYRSRRSADWDDDPAKQSAVIIAIQVFLAGFVASVSAMLFILLLLFMMS